MILLLPCYVFKITTTRFSWLNIVLSANNLPFKSLTAGHKLFPTSLKSPFSVCVHWRFQVSTSLLCKWILDCDWPPNYSSCNVTKSCFEYECNWLIWTCVTVFIFNGEVRNTVEDIISNSILMDPNGPLWLYSEEHNFIKMEQ